MEISFLEACRLEFSLVEIMSPSYFFSFLFLEEISLTYINKNKSEILNANTGSRLWPDLMSQESLKSQPHSHRGP